MEKKEKRDVKSWKEKNMILYEWGVSPPFSLIHCFFSRLFSSPPFSPSLFILFCFFGNMPHHFLYMLRSKFVHICVGALKWEWR